jgi:hypothetical protein
MKVRDERDELEKLLNGSQENIEHNIPTDNSPELQLESTMDVDFDEVRKSCDIEAKQIILNSIGFSLSDDMINNNNIIQSKMNVDIFSLSGMLYQIKCNESMQKALMEEVKRGALHPRMFEVFYGLSATIANLNKQLLQTVEVIKNGYKDIKSDIKEKETETLGPVNSGNNNLLTNGNGDIISYGSKELIRNVKKRMQDSSSNEIIDESQTIIE